MNLKDKDQIKVTDELNAGGGSDEVVVDPEEVEEEPKEMKGNTDDIPYGITTP